ncbi:hypothetical protein [Sphingomonas sp. PAMC 26617]|uniref:hypothetical protein n=1 Tax=Sphingomonas sp. PAMC 26617 TaxID=1112216 RepID=UPI0018DEDF67|nr:hypothetical protein [Sphingomonas sp. PAMC 26617]
MAERDRPNEHSLGNAARGGSSCTLSGPRVTWSAECAPHSWQIIYGLVLLGYESDMGKIIAFIRRRSAERLALRASGICLQCKTAVAMQRDDLCHDCYMDNSSAP